MPTPGEFEAWLDFQRGEYVEPRKPRKCDECGQIKDDTDLYGEDTETQEQIFMCGLCEAKEEFNYHKSHGQPVDTIVKFDGTKTPDPHYPTRFLLSPNWFTNITYGTLLTNGKILWGRYEDPQEVHPPEYEREII